MTSDVVADGSPIPAIPSGTRVALVHDWLTGLRGGEKCFEVFCELFPGADVFTLLHVPNSTSPIIESMPIRTSALQRLPAAERIYRWALPLFPRAMEAFDFSGYDLVLTSSHSVAKSARVAPGALSICYCHTPMRYIWDRFDDYFGDKPAPVRWAIGRVAAGLRRWDRATAGRVHLWLANGNVVRQRILDFYGVDGRRVDIIFPPVDTAVFQPGLAPEPSGLRTNEYDLVVSALVPYKKIDLAVRAAIAAGRHLVVIGKGPEAGRLDRLAVETKGPGKVTFAGAVATADLPGFYTHARCLVFPGLEDFGITPLEATACGSPVVAYRAGGALDTVREGLNGIFFDEQTVDGLAAALADPDLSGHWDGQAMAAHAETFSRENFSSRIADRIDVAWRRHQRGDDHV